MKKIAIIYSDYTPTVDAIIHYLHDIEVVCFKNKIEADDNFDLIVGIDIENYENKNILTVHHSLLPAFEGYEPVKKAFMEGVKVTGITFYYTNPKRIIAQYPVLISNGADFVDVENELKYLVQTLYPIIIEKVLNNQIIDLKSILGKTSCSSCGGCSSCKK